MTIVAEDLVRVQQRMGELRLTVGVPTSVNSMYVNGPYGSRRLSSAAEKYMRDTKALINEAIEVNSWVKPKKGVWMYVDMVFYFPDRRIRDSHNALKLLMDVMQGKVYINDYNAIPRIMSVEYDKDNPRVELRIHAQTPQLRKSHINDTIKGS